MLRLYRLLLTVITVHTLNAKTFFIIIKSSNYSKSEEVKSLKVGTRCRGVKPHTLDCR